VASISPTATVSGGVNSYAVVVSLDSAPQGVRIGQTTTVAVTVAQADNVLRVPLAAVRTAGGRHTVLLVQNGTTSTVAIQVGVEGDAFDEVTFGLTEGQTVALQPTTSSSAGTNGNANRFGGGLGGAGGGFGNFGGGAGGAGAGTGNTTRRSGAGG
jgi:macrolide-specific efflux system membrane fusion protein